MGLFGRVHPGGFTGNQNGMTAKQKEVLRNLLKLHGITELHHGDCIGSDGEAHDIAEELGIEPVIHPPIETRKRAFKKAKRVHAEKPYLKRNKHIVHCATIMFATPKSRTEVQRSGTWSTVRYATTMKVKMLVIYPDGVVRDRQSNPPWNSLPESED